MKRITALLVCLLILLCGCSEQVKDDSFAQSQSCALYDDIIEDYRNIVSFRLLDDFEYLWNYGEFIELSEPLLNALTVSGSDLDYRWSNMIVEMPTADSTQSSFGYILTDINDDNCPELFWVRDDHTVLAVFTVHDEQIVLLDAFWSRYVCVITDDGKLYTRSSGGADITDYELRDLSSDGVLITLSHTDYLFENSQRWLNTEITPLF